MNLSISKEGTSYSNVTYALENLEDLLNDDHICLHPIYDFIAEQDSAIQKYQKLAEKLKKYRG